MSLSNAKNDLRQLVKMVVEDTTIGTLESFHGCEMESIFSSSIPQELVEQHHLNVGMLRLNGDVANQFFKCRRYLLEEGDGGELEHLSQREIGDLLWVFVCEVWIERQSLRHQSQQIAIVKAFIDSHRKKHEKWEVVWEISDLFVVDAFAIADVNFFRMNRETIDDWKNRGKDMLDEIFEQLVGRTFARVIVQAGDKANAINRAKNAVDDALNVFRVVISEAGAVPHQQCLQTRGMQYLVRSLGTPDQSSFGGQRGWESIDLGINEELHDVIVERVEELGVIFNPQLSSKIRGPLLRAVVGIGSSMTRESFDDRVVDLCTGLESMLCFKHEVRKAERISVRYMLLGYAVDEPSFVTHPLSIYDLYLLRNQIVHGSSRRVASLRDCQQLEYVAIDALDRLVEIVSANRSLRSLDALFADIMTAESLSQIVKFIESYSPNIEAVIEVGGLARKWLEQESS